MSEGGGRVGEGGERVGEGGGKERRWLQHPPCQVLQVCNFFFKVKKTFNSTIKT